MSEEIEVVEFPHVYKNEDGAEIVALNDIQGAAFEKGGFKPAGKYVEKKAKKAPNEPQVE